MAKPTYDRRAVRHSSNIFVPKHPASQACKKVRATIYVFNDRVVVVRAGETVDEFMARHGVFDKLLSQINDSPHNSDWEAELEELRNQTPPEHEKRDQRASAAVSKRS